MNVFTKRNALVGFLALKALERRRKRKRSALKLGTLVVLGLVSAGALAMLAVVVVRRQRNGHGEPQHLVGYMDGGQPEEAEPVEATELDADASEPGSAA